MDGSSTGESLSCSPGRSLFDLPFVRKTESVPLFWYVETSSDPNPVRAYQLDCAKGRSYGRAYKDFVRRTELHHLLPKIAAAMDERSRAVQTGFWTELSASIR